MRGDHLEVIRQRILGPALAMDFAEMPGAGATFTLPKFLGNGAKPHRIYIGNANHATGSALEIEYIDEIADLHPSIIELAGRGIIFIGFADGGGLMTGQDLKDQTVVVFMGTPELRAFTAFHLFAQRCGWDTRGRACNEIFWIPGIVERRRQMRITRRSPAPYQPAGSDLRGSYSSTTDTLNSV